MHERLPELADHERRGDPDPLPFDPTRAAQASARTVREREVPRLFHPVVPVELGQERIGVRVVGRELLQMVRDLFAGEHHHQQECLGLRQRARDAMQHPKDGRLVQRVLGGRGELVDQADERARVTRLLADLVEHVGDARIGEVGRLRDLTGEAGREHRLEVHAHRQHRRDLFAREARPLLRGENDRRAVDAEAFQAEQLVGDDLSGAERAPGEVGVGFDRAPAGRRVEPDDLAIRREADGVRRRASSRNSHGHLPSITSRNL